jgi:hypothetical protein
VSLFIAGAAAFLMVVVVLAHNLKTNDPYGLKAARREAAQKARG